MPILIFKTNVETDDAHFAVATVLGNEASVLGWNIDREDIDCVLRIESTENNASHIIQRISQAGFFCEELPG